MIQLHSFYHKYYSYIINKPSMEDLQTEQQRFWLETVFQNGVETGLQLTRAGAPEQTPFVHKYEAIELLKRINEVEHNYKFIIHCALGDLYNEVEQLSDSIRSYQNALKQLVQLSPQKVAQFYQYLIVVYNMLGLSYVNREQIDQGIGCLVKASQIYQAFKEVPGENVYHNRSFQSKGRPFRFFYQGGNDHDQIEDSYTLTEFYLAQAYTKMGLKDKAASYCGMTLQRQHNSGKYELKQFVNNLIGLSEYYQGSKYFAQSQYLLMLATKVIPEGKKFKLRASIHISLGNLIGQLLEFSCLRIENKDCNQGDSQLISKQLLLFKEFQQSFPQVALPTDIEGCKSLFRQANTQFKKALDVFVLDGYVTEHIQILHSQSKLYKSLALLEKSNDRKASMLEKRRQMLEPLLKELNPKAYPATWQKILVQTSEIINDLFNLRVAMLGAKGIPTEEKLNQSCELGRKSIAYYKQIITTLIQDKDIPHNDQYYRSIINSKINIAKATSKLMSSDRKTRVGYLKTSWEHYQGIINYIQTELPADIRNSFEKQVELTREMIAMMPNKIDRINYGQMSYVE